MFRLLNLLRTLLLTGLALTALRAQEPSVPSGDFLLQPQDLIKVQVFQEPDLLREVRISQEGTINLPLINQVDLRNKTLRQAEQLIRDLYDRDFLVNPQITLVVVEYAKRTVNVLGNVNLPGAVPFPQEQKLNLIDAITRAGGFNRLADRKRVKLTRTSTDGKSETVEINADQLMNKGASAEKWVLQVGDTVYVPERVL
ncbi:sugar transporter [Nibricoccus aquaticus]|uniref:Sugar transporter n=1 Tax=Nibricoccus aquaticus TaxID=2576891 RepID=A0A290Q6X4_9BACT|nr:polysaccharide biosynthesis/export family protein [Nibricoccus aquaticus]ATC64399.1 sugar transporter [Nibricoccus aquaticus]